MGVDGGEEFKTTKQLQYRVLGCQECCISRRKKKSVKSRQLSEPCDSEEGVSLRRCFFEKEHEMENKEEKLCCLGR